MNRLSSRAERTTRDIMIKSRRLFAVLCLLYLAYIVACPVAAGAPQTLYPIDITLVALDSLAPDVPIAFRLTATTNKNTLIYKVKSLSVRIEPWGGLALTGSSSWSEVIDSATEYSREFNLIIPNVDTSGFVLYLDMGWGDDLFEWSFVPSGTSVTMFNQDVRKSAAWDREREMMIAHGVASEKAKRDFQIDSLGAVHLLRTPEQVAESISIYNDTAWHGSPATGWSRVRKLTKGESDLARMRQLETKPLTDSVQHFILDGTCYVRYRGEMEFRPGGEALTMDQWAERTRQEWAAHPKDTTSYEILVEVNDSLQLARVKSLVQSIAPTKDPRVYRVRTEKSTHYNLEIRGIKCVPSSGVTPDMWPYKPAGGAGTNDTKAPVPIDSPADSGRSSGNSDPSESQESHSPEGVCNVLSDGFEHSWSWNSWDEDANSGSDFWGQYSGCSYTGTYSVWSAKNGALGSWYDNDMNAWMQKWVDLSGMEVDGRRLKFQVYYDTEAVYDRGWVCESADGYTWVKGQEFTGFSDWKQVTYGLTLVNVQFVAFVFKSDVSICSYEGMFVDDVCIEGVALPSTTKPDLAVGLAPGWSAPLVASPVQFTHTFGQLMANQTTYVDWSVANIGDAISGSFKVALYLDNVSLLGTWTMSGLQPGYLFESYQLDYPITVPHGFHWLTAIFDVDETVDEWAETNNEYPKQFFWANTSDLVISVTGIATFFDSTSGKYLPIRNANISLWDYDAIGPATQWLKSATTLDDGTFQFDNIYNRETGGDWGNQDIYVQLESSNAAALISTTSGSTRYPYVEFSDTIYEADDGAHVLNLQVPPNKSGPFFIADALLDGQRKWKEVANQTIAQVDVYLDASGERSRWTPALELIFIEKGNDVSQAEPDVWDKFIILHEYAHVIATTNGFFKDSYANNWRWDKHEYAWNQIARSLPGSTWLIDPFLAAREGWACFFPAWVTGNKLLRDSWTNLTQYDEYNIENGEYGRNGTVYSSSNDLGLVGMASVGGILWDIHDYNATIEDYSKWGGGPGIGVPDGKGDALSYYGGEIVVNAFEKLPRPASMSEFYLNWASDLVPIRFGDLKNIYYEHGVTPCDVYLLCCSGSVGNVDNDPGGGVDISDLSRLIDFLYISFGALVCEKEANIDGDGQCGVDISDLSVLIDHMFISLSPLPNCQ